MEKEALLAIIINDLKEVDILMNTFNKPGAIDKDFLQLAMTKINHITNEMKMLEKYSSTSEQITAPLIAQTSEPEPSATPATVNPEPAVIVKEVIKESNPTPRDYFTLETASEEIKEETRVIKDEIEPISNSTTTKKENVAIETPQTSINEVKAPAPKVEEIKAEIEEKVTIAPKIEQKVKEEPKKEEPHTLKDVIAQNKKSVNDVMNEKKVSPQPLGANIVVPVANIYKAIGINDKLLFQRELFGGKGDLMNQVIDQLNEMKSYDDAHAFLSSAFDWNFENERVISFLNIVKRRYL
ncbi:MAG: hypothetical protein KBG80_02020 [Breznakibacter sp.]|nr:hypothetical protein [Breznakibacter sp.]